MFSGGSRGNIGKKRVKMKEAEIIEVYKMIITVARKLISITWYNNLHCVKCVQIRSFFWSVSSRIRTEYGEVRSFSPYSVRMRENTDQKKLLIWTLFIQCQEAPISYYSTILSLNLLTKRFIIKKNCDGNIRILTIKNVLNNNLSLINIVTAI